MAGIVCPRDVFFLSQTKPEIFSPHIRANQTADHPVSFEVVPKGVKAEWDVLIFDAFREGKAMTKYALLVLNAIRDLIEELGMSAKRTSGFGIGKDLKVSLFAGNGFSFPGGDRSVADAVKILEACK